MLAPQEMELQMVPIRRMACGHWEWNPGTLEEVVLLTAQPSLQALNITFQLPDIRKKLNESHKHII